MKLKIKFLFASAERVPIIARIMGDYFIRGEDGKDYGPVALEELRQWARENRAGPGMLVTRAHFEQAWQPWETYPELAAISQELEAHARALPQPEALAPLWRRALAYASDMLWIAIVVEVVMMPLGLWLPKEQLAAMQASIERIGRGDIPLSWMFSLWAMQILYWTYFHGKWGQTPGKKMARIRLVSERGEKPGFAQAFLRALVTVISSLPCGLGFWVAFVDPGKRTLHDMVAKTYVVREEPVAPAPPSPTDF